MLPADFILDDLIQSPGLLPGSHFLLYLYLIFGMSGQLFHPRQRQFADLIDIVHGG